MALKVELLPALQDNYIFLLHDEASGATAVIDPGEAAPVLTALNQRGWQLDAIWLTHHHADHVDGTAPLRLHFPDCEVIGAAADQHRLPPLTQTVGEGAELFLGAARAEVLEIPGHTLGHLAFHFPQSAILFCGDTLFGLGCGRRFEGSAEQMWQSLERICALPPSTQVYCAHEYTQANARFALSVEPNHPPLIARVARVSALRSQGQPTVPLDLAEELATNPFLRPASPLIRQSLGMEQAKPWQVFGELRHRKDHFGK